MAKVLRRNSRHMNGVWLWPLTLTMGLIVSAQGWAECLPVHASYAVTVDGQHSGTMSIERRTQGSGMAVISRTHLQISHWTGDTEMRSVTAEQYENGLRKADTRVQENGNTRWSQVARQEDEFWLSSTQVNTASEAEEQAFVEATSGLLSGMIPGLADVLSVVQLFSASDGQESGGLRIGVGEIDSTLLNLPCFWIDNQRQLPGTLSLLDTEELAVFGFALQETSDESRVVNDSELIVRHYTYQSELGQRLQLWLGLTDWGPVIARLDWHDDDISYQLELAQVQELKVIE